MYMYVHVCTYVCMYVAKAKLRTHVSCLSARQKNVPRIYDCTLLCLITKFVYVGHIVHQLVDVRYS